MKTIRDIFLAYLVCAGIIAAVSLPIKDKAQSFYAFHSAFAHPSSAALAWPEKQNEKIYERRFVWQDPSKIKRETLFRLPEQTVKKEIRRFGVNPATSSSFFMEKRGFKVIGRRNVIYNNQIHEEFIRVVDYRQIFQRHLGLFEPLTVTLMQSAQLTGQRDPLFPFLLFVQQIRYRLPPKRYKGRFINSFFVPLVVLYEQYGDCDSKSLLLAQFLCTTPLANSFRKAGKRGEKVAIVLINGKGLSHAVLAVKRPQLPGMTSLNDLRKGNFILLETTQPGWSPGFIHPRVTDTIKAGMFQFVELN